VVKICGKGHEYTTKQCSTCERARWERRVTNDHDKRREYTRAQQEADDRNIVRYLIRIAKARAKELNVECTITPGDVVLVTRCPITLRPMNKHRGQFDRDSYTLDRVDSELGYVPGNVRVISWGANNAKRDLSLDEVERLLAYMKGEL
jgi:hypothetical protein